MKNVLNSAMVLIGTFIGAGFASGQEVLQYFGVFGKLGTAGIIISCFILGIFTYCTADNINCMGEKKYIEQVCCFKWVNWLLNCYMVLIFCTMITAFGECMSQAFDLPKIFGVVLIDAVTILTLYFGADGVVKLNAVVTPLIISGIIFACIVNNTVEVFSYNNFVTSAIIYTSYNIISMPFVMVGMKNLFTVKRDMVLCSVIFSITIFILAICILRLLQGADSTASIPLLNTISEKYVFAFILVLAMSMLTTAVSNGYGFINGVGLNNNIMLSFLGIFAIIFSAFSFGFIVKYLYSFFGYMGLYILLINFWIFIKNREKPRKSKIANDK